MNKKLRWIKAADANDLVPCMQSKILYENQFNSTQLITSDIFLTFFFIIRTIQFFTCTNDAVAAGSLALNIF